MKIVLYGASAAGKTTFITSIYGLMKDGLSRYSKLRGGVNDFTIKCKNVSQGETLERDFIRFKNSGYYPEMTIDIDSYNFGLYYNGEEITNFEIVDFFGELIHDRTQQNASSEKMREQIRNADAILMFVDSTKVIKKKLTVEETKALRQNLINCVDVRNRRLYLYCLFTKADLAFKHSGSKRYWSKNMPKLEKSVEDLAHMAEGNSNLIFESLPIACTPDCFMDIDYVLLKLISIGITRDYYARSQAANSKAVEIETLYKQRSIIASFFGLSEKEKRARAMAADLQVELNNLERIENIQKSINSYTERYVIPTSYAVGKRVRRRMNK